METDINWCSVKGRPIAEDEADSKTHRQTSSHLKHEVSSEEFEAFGALRVTIVTTNLEYLPTPAILT